MQRWLFVLLIILLLALRVINELTVDGLLATITLALLNITVLVSIYVILKRGSFYYSRLYRIVYLFIAVIFVGMLARFQHWSIASNLLITGYAGILLLYTTHFATKRNRTSLDFLKLSYAVSATLGIIIATQKYDVDYGLSVGLAILSVVSIILLSLLLFYYFRNPSERVYIRRNVTQLKK